MLKTISAALVAASLISAPAALATSAVKAPHAKTQTHTMKKTHHHRAEYRHHHAPKHAGVVTTKKHVSSHAPRHIVVKKKV